MRHAGYEVIVNAGGVSPARKPSTLAAKLTVLAAFLAVFAVVAVGIAGSAAPEGMAQTTAELAAPLAARMRGPVVVEAQALQEEPPAEPAAEEPASEPEAAAEPAEGEVEEASPAEADEAPAAEGAAEKGGEQKKAKKGGEQKKAKTEHGEKGESGEGGEYAEKPCRKLAKWSSGFPIPAKSWLSPSLSGFTNLVSPGAFSLQISQMCTATSSGVVFIMNTIPPKGIGAVYITFKGKASIPYGKSYS
jgi:hypothetical protein